MSSVSQTEIKFKGLDPTQQYKPKEKFAREIGQELERLNWPHVVAKESPRKRDFNKLLKRYESRFVIDLHDPARGFDTRWDPPGRIAHVVYSATDSHYKFMNKFQKKYYSGKFEWKGQRDVPELPNDGISYDKFNRRLFKTELYPWVGRDKTLKFLYDFTGFLQSTDLYV